MEVRGSHGLDLDWRAGGRLKTDALSETLIPPCLSAQPGPLQEPGTRLTCDRQPQGRAGDSGRNCGNKLNYPNDAPGCVLLPSQRSRGAPSRPGLPPLPASQRLGFRPPSQVGWGYEGKPSSSRASAGDPRVPN